MRIGATDRYSRDDAFDLESGRYRSSGGEFTNGPPKDFDTEADRFRALDGQFKKQSSYGADNVRSKKIVRRGESRSSRFGMGDDFKMRDSDKAANLGIGEVELDF